MTDQDYIKAGVELADGWEWEEEYDGEVVLTSPDMEWYQDCISQSALDALAAQLERQYQDGCCRTLSAFLWINYLTEMRRQNLGTDLTMWKLRYLVDRAKP